MLFFNGCTNSDFKHIMNLNKNWQLQSSEKIIGTGDKISSPDFETRGWLTAEVPSTIMGCLMKNNVYKNIFVGKNINLIPTEQFKKSWWYRTSFQIPDHSDITCTKIEFDGIIYRANIWLNGKQIGNADTIFGSYRQFSFNISSLVKKNKTNILAVEVFPPKPGDFTVGFVDWNPEPPDKNMGIWREVRLRFSHDVSINHPFVQTKLDTKNFLDAQLSISCEIINNNNNLISGVVEGNIEDIHFSKEITLQPNETKLISFSPDEYKQLNIIHPRVWWTYDLGTPELYKLKLTFKTNHIISDVTETNFGIREIKDYLNEKGHRGYILNGKKILIRGGGWVDKLFLEYDSSNLENQIRYVKHMNLNTIRLEGIWGNNQHLFDLCDQYGILLMVGWSCQWEWENYLGKKCDENFGGIQTKEDMDLIANSWTDEVKWLRNHPSICIWMLQSDLLPKPEMEKRYLEIFKKEDPSRPFVASAKGWNSEITGPTGVKMLGPYEYVPPIYWYIDTANGGAYGFNTETGPGAQVPPVESIRQMMSTDSYWPMNDEWDFHCGRNEFKSLKIYNHALLNRLGKSDSLEDYCRKAQFINYESIRPMYEAFTVNRYQATGVIQWMLNASWPKLFWQLYDYYLIPNGAFYAVRKACEPIHILYNYGNNTVMVSNKTFENINHYKANIKLMDMNMNEILSKTVDFNISKDSTITLLNLPELKNNKENLFYLDLRLTDDKQQTISINQYFITKKPDQLDFKNSNWFYTPVKEFADLKELNHLKKSMVKESLTYEEKNNIIYFTVNLRNYSKLAAFFIEIRIVKDNTDESILPVFIEDNYVSLLPLERRQIKGYIFRKDLGGKTPIVKINGFNL